MEKAMKKENKRKTISKKKKKCLSIVFAGFFLTAAACYTVFLAPILEKEQWIYKEEVVKRGTLKIGVTESGSLEYGITSVLYNLDVSEEDDEEDEDDEDDEAAQKYLKVEEVYVSPGQRIARGDILFRFTEDSIADVRMLLNSAAAEAESEYVQALAEYNLSALEAGTDCQIRELDAQYASSIYTKSAQAISNEVAMLQVEINQCAANSALLQEKLEEMAEKYDEASRNFTDAEKPSVEKNNTVNYMTLQKDYLDRQTQYENAKSALNLALQELEDNAREMETLQKELTAALAKTTVSRLDAEEVRQESLINGENAQITYEAEQESLKETLQEAEEKRDKIQEQLKDFETFVGEDGCLYADGTGIVTEVVYEPGDRLRDAGVMLSYAAPDDMTISVDVTQEDIVDLEVGDQVDITFTAYEDVSYGGSIYSINTTATSRESNTVSYTVVIAVEGDTTALYGGMTADIVFVTEQKEDVIYISKKAILEENGKSYVYYKTPAGEMELKEVQTGIHNGINIEILSGLEEGDTIYLASRVSSEDAVKVSGDPDTEGSVPGGGIGDGEYILPDGIDERDGIPGGEMPGGEIPGGGMPDGGMPSGGMPGGEMPGGGMPDGGMPSGGMPGGGMPGDGGR